MRYFLGKVFFVFCFSLSLWAQEEESAELFLEEYTDEFQNLFFEALKQKGIQNYQLLVKIEVAENKNNSKSILEGLNDIYS